MKYHDRIYGTWDITEPVIVEIIGSSAFQRLKGVDQAGYFDVYHPGTKHSRFEHSVGCYLLLRKFNASLDEQIAGLIHDLSHCAFSHTADYVFAEGRGADHNYQDDIFEDFVRTTDIPSIIQKYGFDIDHILDEKNFPLQENTLPDICADRIDYSLRGAMIYAGKSQEVITDLLSHLRVQERQWVFDSYDAAYSYARIFKMLNDQYYSGKETAAMFGRSARWLQYAVQKKYITHEELFSTDEEVIKKINAHLPDDDHLRQLWRIMNDPHIICGDMHDPDVYEVVVKSRIIDPLFIENNTIKRVSEQNTAWSDVVHADSEPRIYYINDTVKN
jgi:HD superfamily phosphohydrolase